MRPANLAGLNCMSGGRPLGESKMNSTDMVTDFVVRKDLYETHAETFTCSEKARQACIKLNLDPFTAIRHTVIMSTVQSLLKAINAYCGKLAEEYDFSLNFDLKPDSLIPEKFRDLIAYAVEGSNEGYYVHVGAIMDGGKYQQFGIAKTYSSESAYELAKQTSRFLAAAVWN
jgi:hypothetical protein